MTNMMPYQILASSMHGKKNIYIYIYIFIYIYIYKSHTKTMNLKYHFQSGIIYLMDDGSTSV